MDSVLGIDLGTSSVKSAVYNLTGKLLAAAEATYPTTYHQPGQVEQNPEHWIAAISDSLKVLGKQLPLRDIKAIGLSAHAPAIIPADEDGSPLLASVPIWNDLRCVPNGQWLLNFVGEEYLWTGPGTALAAYYPQLHWLAMHYPDAIRQARWLLSPKDLIGHWLTGQARTDPSTSAGEAQWREDLLELCGVPPNRLPALQQPTDRVGALQQSIANRFDMQSGIPVITGLNDGAAASIAANAFHVGDVIITLGTNGVVRIVADKPTSGPWRLKAGVFCWPYVNGRWIIGGHTRVGANVLGWLSTILGGDVSHVEDIIELAATAPPGANGVLFLPYLMGRGTPFNDEQASGSLHGLTLSSDRQSISRAVLEGLTFALCDVYQALPQAAQPTAIHITGGGAKSAVWTQIIADIFNYPVKVYSVQPAVGAAIVAAVGVGIYPTVPDAAAKMANLSSTQVPIEQHRGVYQQAHHEFLTLQARGFL